MLRISRIITASLLFCLSFNVVAQNNPYKIKDNLYAIFLYANKIPRNNLEFVHVMDSMFAKGKAEHDIKAQCIALQLKNSYYSRHTPYNEEQHRKYLNYCKAFIAKTEYKQYYFACWNTLIIHYTNSRQYSKALEELKEYQKDALKFKNNYGISFSYMNMGNIYKTLHLHAQAIEQYTKGIEYLESVGDDKEISYFYRLLGEIAIQEVRNDDAYFYLTKALNLAKTDGQKSLCLYFLFYWAIETKQPESVMEYWYKRFYEIPNSSGSVTATFRLLMDYEFYKHKKDTVKADYYFKEYLKSSEYAGDYNIVANWHADHSDFKSAFEYQKLYTDRIDSAVQSGIAQVAALYSVQYDNTSLKLSQRELELENKQFQIERMGAEQRFLLTNREKDSLMILSVRQYHRADSIQKEKAVLEAEKKQKEALWKQRNYAIVFTVVVLLSVLYFITQKRHNRRLKKEKSIAVEEKSKAEQAQAISEETGRKLVVALEEAKKADKLKSQFLNNMSHEIRTPLNAIVGFTEVLNGEMAGELADDERKEMLMLVEKNSSLLTALINDLLDLSRMQSGNYKAAPKETGLNDLCRDTVSSVKNRAADGVTMSFDAHPVDKVIFSDSNRIAQVLIKYLTNACKYTEAGTIRLDYRTYVADDGCEWVDFSVTDTGSGIPADKAEDVFNRFEKLDEFKQGTGLGLNICKTIADLLHGRVWLDTTYTTGCRFVFSVPCDYGK